jgi:histidyl-tRNA synthetase
MLETNPPKGLRDFFPRDLLLRDRVFGAWRNAAELHGFLRYEAPVVESFELLARKAGEEITDQIYVFQDKSGRNLALRPEVTPSLVRMLSANVGEHLFPAKWWTIAQCFRYEKMGKGRRREHYQWNLDIVGAESILAEAWILHAAVAALQQLGLGSEDIQIHVNHRQLLARALDELGVPEDRHPGIFLILDKKDKIPEAALVEMLLAAGMAAPLCRRLLEMMQIGSLDELRASPLGQSAPAGQLYQLFAMAKSLGFDRFLTFDFGIVRGLAYYTGVIFEAYDVPRKFRAVFGGGRYDTLFQRLAGTDRPAVGLGFGDVVIGEILAARPGFTAPSLAVDVCVGSFDDSLTVEAFRVASQLQQRGITVDLAVSVDKPRKFFAYASKRGAALAVFVGPDEIQRQAVMLRNMQTREQREVPIGELGENALRDLKRPVE